MYFFGKIGTIDYWLVRTHWLPFNNLTQTVAGLVEQQLDEAVGKEKMSSDVEPGDGSGNRRRLLRRHSL